MQNHRMYTAMRIFVIFNLLLGFNCLYSRLLHISGPRLFLNGGPSAVLSALAPGQLTESGTGCLGGGVLGNQKGFNSRRTT